jgi:diacylglycerol kinase family enzyme
MRRTPVAESQGIQVIATTISGSIKDWGKVERIVPLFKEMGREDVTLVAVGSHSEARQRAGEVVAAGCREVISAGGSGTFNAVLEGCLDSGANLADVSLGFLRKGSADLIGKVLGMPDEIEEAVSVFVESLAAGKTLPCDVIRVENRDGDVPRHLVGYGGAEIFGRIPHYTENRFIKLYKGVLSQLFGDLGPFFVGAVLASTERSVRTIFGGKREWAVEVDGGEVARGRYQAMILVNGDLGKDLPFAKGVPLGSGDFHLFGLRDLGPLRLPGQFKKAFDSSILEDPERWGFEAFRIGDSLTLTPSGPHPFPVNRDGSTMMCSGAVSFRIVGQVRLVSGGGISNQTPGGGSAAP